MVASGPGAHRLEDFVRFRAADGFDRPRAFAADPSRVHPGSLWRNPADRPATEVARRFGLRGPVHCVTTACAASLQAIGSAVREIRAGRADWMLAGGADAMVDPMGLVFFVLLNAAATEAGPHACRPFSRRRTGMVTGEGAGLAVLEREDHARARGATILCEVAGYGSSLDAFRVTAPHPEGRGADPGHVARPRRRRDRSPDEVDLVSAHATGTKLNDPAEAKAIRAVFGARADRVAVTSGSPRWATCSPPAGAVAFAGAVLAVARDEVPHRQPHARGGGPCLRPRPRDGRAAQDARAGRPGERARVRRAQCHDPPAQARRAAAGARPVNRTDLKDRVAVVTGGARGIGAAISRRLAAAGAIVVVNYAKGAAAAEALVAEVVAAGGRRRGGRGRRREQARRGREAVRGRPRAPRRASTCS